ncbi:MAG: hypothetical protein HY752_00880 [Nitrospirae bacterium]|nr:hypothetical protein [Nitrospirota bacterium]
MRKLCRVTLFFFAFCILTFSLSFALETITHEKINEFIAINTLNGFSLDSYLKNQLGFANGITEDIKSTETKKVFEWIKVGGLYEDNPPWTIPYFRSANHFHNPINKQGFSGIWGTGFVSGESSIPWSQKAIGTQSPGGYYSWYDARDYFYKALTATDKNTREKNFSDTFRGLGQLMHLVEDLSVPEHTRNDGHYLKAYEGWVKDTQKSNDPQRKAIFDTALANPIFFNKDALNQPSAFSTAPVPIANLFDTNTYNGSNPDVTINNNIGLSEYTNANFVSPDTRFKNFAYPSKDTSVVVVDYDIADPFNPGNTVKRPYYKKKADGDSGYLLTGVDYHRLYRQTNLSEPELGQLEVVVIAPMDGNVFSDYTKRLLPRAVGYSAGLLNYFFRGDIDLVDDATTGSGYVIVNNTEEDMNGTFER